MTATKTATFVPTGSWAIDPAHSRVGFAVKHMGIATVRGEFKDFDGKLEVGDAPLAIRASGSVRAGSVDTNEQKRDAHLRSADFFEVDAFPEIAFEATEVEPAADGTYRIAGSLTLHGVTRPLELKAVPQGGDTDPWGNERVALEVSGELNRSDYGMRFNQALGSGNVLVSDKVKLVVDVSAVKQDE